MFDNLNFLFVVFAFIILINKQYQKKVLIMIKCYIMNRLPINLYNKHRIKKIWIQKLTDNSFEKE